MFWKTLALAFLAVGVVAEYQVTDEQRQQFKSMLTQYCKKNGAEDKADDVEKAVMDFKECMLALIDPDTIKKEIEESKPKGTLDEVFKKYCAKSPQIKGCIHTLSAGVTPCIENQFREHINTANNITDQLLDFVCYKDGDRIALFIAEGGPECFQTKANEIRDCATNLRDTVGSVEAAKSLTLPEQCAKVDTLTQCIVTALEKCNTPTPANMAESLFKYIRNASPCPKKSS